MTTTNHTNAIAGRRRPILGWIAAIAAVVLLVGACASSRTVDLASLGLDIDTDIQAGSQFEVAVPIQPGTTITVASAPPGVTASISKTAAGESILLSVAVDAGTPRGTYRLALLVIQDEEEYQLDWPFDVVDGVGTSTTASAPIEGILKVNTPLVGVVFPSPSPINGESSSPTVDYVLSAGGNVLAEGTIDVIDGEFSAIVDFTNTCCIEMTLEVFQPGASGATLTIPLAFPEPG